jgi:hypothetical protein
MKDLMPFITSLKSSFLYSTVHLLYCRVGGGYYYFRIHVKEVIAFFCDAGGGTGHFV